MTPPDAQDDWLAQVLGVAVPMAAPARGAAPAKPFAGKPVKVAAKVSAVAAPLPAAPGLDDPTRPRSGAVVAPRKPATPATPVKGAKGRPMAVAHGANGKVTLIAAPPAVDTITLSGGGGKGAALPGAVRALEQSGVLKDVKLITGASVGSMTAAMVAAGATADEFEAISNDPKIAGTIKQGKNMAEVIFGGGLTGEGLEGLVRGKMCGTIGKRIIEYVQAEAAAGRRPDAGVLAIARKIAEGKKGPTFGDMRTLSQVIPAIKEVSISGSFMGEVDKASGKYKDGQPQLMIFSADTEPDMEVALAVHASAALPPVFKPVDIPLGSGVTARFQDGGVLNNAPTPDSYDAEREIDPVPDSRTMTFVFEDEAAHEMLQGKAVPRQDSIADFFADADNSAAEYAKNRNLADNPDDVVMLPLVVSVPPAKPGGKATKKDFSGLLSGTMNFDMPLPDKLLLQAKADAATRANIQKNQQPRAREFDSAEQMLICIPRADLAALANDKYEGAAQALQFRDQVCAKVAQLTARVQALAAQPAASWPQDKDVAAALAELDGLSADNDDRQGFVARELNRSGKLDNLIRALPGSAADKGSDLIDASLAVNDAVLARAHAKAVLRDLIYPMLVDVGGSGVAGTLLMQVDDRLRDATSAAVVNDALGLAIAHFKKRADPLGLHGYKKFASALQGRLMKITPDR